MNYCANCGSVVPPSGVCSNCGTVHQATPPPMQQGPPPPMHHGAPPPPPMHQGPPPPMHQGPPPMHHGHPPMHHYPRPSYGPNPFDVAMNTLRSFFSRSPESSIGTALSSSLNTWFIWFPLYAIVAAIGVTVVYSALIAMIPMGMGAFIPDFRGLIFVLMLFVIAISFFISAGAVMLVFVMYKVRISFLKVMDLVAVTYLPLIMAIVIGTIFGIVSFSLGFAFVMVGSYASLVMLYRGMSEVAGEGNSIFWGFVGMYAAFLIIPSLMLLPLQFLF